jgi:hypothetical protein
VDPGLLKSLPLPALLQVQEVWRLRDDERELETLRTTSSLALGGEGEGGEVVVDPDAVPEEGPAGGAGHGEEATVRVKEVRRRRRRRRRRRSRCYHGADDGHIGRQEADPRLVPVKRRGRRCAGLLRICHIAAGMKVGEKALCRNDHPEVGHWVTASLTSVS